MACPSIIHFINIINFPTISHFADKTLWIVQYHFYMRKSMVSLLLYVNYPIIIYIIEKNICNFIKNANILIGAELHLLMSNQTDSTPLDSDKNR